jgi:hypothetical protein
VVSVCIYRVPFEKGCKMHSCFQIGIERKFFSWKATEQLLVVSPDIVFFERIWFCHESLSEWFDIEPNTEQLTLELYPKRVKGGLKVSLTDDNEVILHPMKKKKDDDIWDRTFFLGKGVAIMLKYFMHIYNVNCLYVLFTYQDAE